jgi:hypothetical protein
MVPPDRSPDQRDLRRTTPWDIALSGGATSSLEGGAGGACKGKAVVVRARERGARRVELWVVNSNDAADARFYFDQAQGARYLVAFVMIERLMAREPGSSGQT